MVDMKEKRCCAGHYFEGLEMGSTKYEAIESKE